MWAHDKGALGVVDTDCAPLDTGGVVLVLPLGISVGEVSWVMEVSMQPSVEEVEISYASL